VNPAIAAIAGLLLLTGPSGRPPAGPLQRYQPRVYDVTFDVSLNTEIHRFDPDWTGPRLPQRDVLTLVDTPIVMPLIFQGAYSRIVNDSVGANLWLDVHPDLDLRQRFRIDGTEASGQDFPHHIHLAVLPIRRFQGQTLRWNISFRAQCWSSRIDDRRAAEIPWPREMPRDLIDETTPPRPWPRCWPEEVADGLKPQMFIESDDPMIVAEMARLSAAANLRMMPPYLAAKTVVQHCLSKVRVTVNGTHHLVLADPFTTDDHPFFRDFKLHAAPKQIPMIKGLKVRGASWMARQAEGSPHDLVCLCVASLRAAGIPARPVIGTQEGTKPREHGGFAAQIVSWAEFYLPAAGWVPFDPDELRGQAINNRDVRDPWPEFGTMDDLNERIPLAYHFIPPRAVQSPQYPALWGWDPRPQGAPQTTEQWIYLSITSRGPGINDPR